MTTPVLELAGILKDYRGLRPLRIEHLSVAFDERVALVGFDQPSAEVFVNLVTGATLPDKGEVRVFGRPTAAIADGSDWLATVDRFGIVSERAVLLDALSVIQNLAMPFTLAIEPPAPEFRARAEVLARETGLEEDCWDRPVAEIDGGRRARVRLGRALALDPAVLLLEHPTAGVGRPDVLRLGRDVREIATARGIALLAATADEEFAAAAATRVLVLRPATGTLVERRRGLLARFF